MFRLAVVIAVCLVGCGGGTANNERRSEQRAEGASSPAEDDAADTAAPEAVEMAAPLPTEPPPNSVRLLIGGADGARIARFLRRHSGGEAGCVDVSGAPVCGQVIERGGFGHDLASSGTAPEVEVVPDIVIIEPETNLNRRMLRIRVQGAAAEIIAKLIRPPDMVASDPAQMGEYEADIFGGDDHKCFVARQATTCGFILERDGRAYHLEYFGYD